MHFVTTQEREGSPQGGEVTALYPLFFMHTKSPFRDHEPEGAI